MKKVMKRGDTAYRHLCHDSGASDTGICGRAATKNETTLYERNLYLVSYRCRNL